MAVGVSNHAEEGEADAEELGGGVSERGSGAHRGGAVRSDVQPRTWAGPNRAVQTVLGVLVLKEMFDLTDMEALEELEFNLLWHHALRLEMEEARLAQKTLHNFRVRLMEHDGGRLAFSETTDRMIAALGLRTGKQRLDSTHVMSNIAVLTRLGLF